MCGRMTLKTPAEAIVEAFQLDEAPPALPARYNIAPTQEVAVVVADAEAPRKAHRRLEFRRWGIGADRILARAETVFDRRTFRKAARRRRCAVVADGFYEWRSTGGPRQPYYYTLRGGTPFAMAAIEEGAGVAVLTTRPNEVVAPIHDRMPVILARDALARWLDPAAEPGDLDLLLRPFPAGAMQHWPVSTHVNRAEHDDPRCCARAEPLSGGVQGTLF